MDSTEQVAFVGLGRMGRPMAENLAVGLGALRVWNRTGATARDFAAHLRGRAQVRVADSPADAVSDASVLVTMLADADAVEEVLFGRDGAAEAFKPGAVVVDMSTIGSPAAADVALRLARRGVEFLDAPVSGSVGAARDATLTIMVGGDGHALERATPLLDLLGERVVACGGTGSGAAMKVCVNALLNTLNAGVAEALVLAERSGIARETAYDVFADSSVGAPFIRYKRDAFTAPDDAPAAFALSQAGKDLRLARALASDVNAPTPVLGAVSALVEDACAHGHGPRDLSSVAVHLREDGR